MTAKTPSVHDDLAFMRGLVEGGGGVPAAFGEAYLAGGLIYGLQILIQSSQALGLPPLPPLGQLAAGLAPTAIFLGVLTWITWRHRSASPGGSTSRAVAAIFGCLGFTNFALIAVIGSVALRRHSLEVWLIYPCVVYVLQGAAWLVASALRRRAWQGLLGVGWFAAGIAMALCIDSIGRYALVAGLGMLILMAIPGAAIVRMARKAA